MTDFVYIFFGLNYMKIYNNYIWFPLDKTPVFTGPLAINVFEGINWKHHINAKPFGGKQQLSYQILSSFGELNISSDGIVSGNPVADLINFNFTVIVEDSCGFSSKQEFKVLTKECICEEISADICVWKNSTIGLMKPECTCAEGCGGPRCVNI